jgi:hypothetical protein
MGRNLLNCSALELLINLNLLEASLLPHLSPADRAAQLDTGKESQLFDTFLLYRFLRKLRCCGSYESTHKARLGL